MANPVNTVDTLNNLDGKLLDLLNKAYILVGTSNEENRADEISTITAESAIQKELSDTSVREKFVEKCLEILGSLETTLINIIDLKADEPELLGIKDMSLIHTMLEIVISWGIYPCLMSGVGIPISRRTRSRQFQHAEKKLPPQSRYIYLFKLMQSLMKITYSSSLKLTMFTTVSSIIRARHLTDFYSALLQLAYGPLPTNDKLDVHSENKLVTSSQHAKALTMLLGSPLHPAPKWLKNVCGRFLTKILLRPNGVRDVMNFMIDGESEGLIHIIIIFTLKMLIDVLHTELHRCQLGCH
ncbi:3655_t:CDS:2, partial [Racocetra fulgida]